jgi:hypothetical protein
MKNNSLFKKVLLGHASQLRGQDVKIFDRKVTTHLHSSSSKKRCVEAIHSTRLETAPARHLRLACCTTGVNIGSHGIGFEDARPACLAGRLPTGTRQAAPRPSSKSAQKIIGSRYSLHASGAAKLLLCAKRAPIVKRVGRRCRYYPGGA